MKFNPIITSHGKMKRTALGFLLKETLGNKTDRNTILRNWKKLTNTIPDSSLDSE
jgi:hypothetical protein